MIERLKFATSTICAEDREKLRIILTNLGVILRLLNCSHKLDNCKLERICKDAYKFIVNSLHIQLSLSPT